MANEEKTEKSTFYKHLSYFLIILLAIVLIICLMYNFCPHAVLKRIKDICLLITPFITLFGFFVGIYQYNKNERLKIDQYNKNEKLKRRDLVIDEISDFYDESKYPKIHDAMRILNYKESFIRDYDGDGFIADDDLKTIALDEDAARRYNPKTRYVNECMNEFLDYLSHFQILIEQEIITANDLKPHLNYYLEVIAGTDDPRIERPYLEPVWRIFIYRYYKKIPNLLNYFHIPIAEEYVKWADTRDTGS